MDFKKRGLLLVTASVAIATAAYAEEAKREGVILSQTSDGYEIRTREGPLHVVMSPNTSIQQVKGLSRKDRTRKDMMNGLIITVEGDQQGNTIHAEKVRYKESDWRNAVATRGGTQQEFAELRQAIIDGNEYVIREEATVYFATGSSAVGPQFRTELMALAKKAPTYGNYRISILGFADPRGNAEANERLSQKRAAAVSNYLRQTGSIQPGRVLSPSAMGEGTAAPGEAAPTSNDEARRVVVRVVTPKGQLTQ
jgi:outer membrane protein OmpA-like peptidoglycan-associated protein